MWYNLSLRGINFPLGYLYKLGVYTKNVTVSEGINYFNSRPLTPPYKPFGIRRFDRINVLMNIFQLLTETLISLGTQW
jgi:hypothetical protein